MTDAHELDVYVFPGRSLKGTFRALDEFIWGCGLTLSSKSKPKCNTNKTLKKEDLTSGL